MEEAQQQQLSRGALMNSLNEIGEQIKITLAFLKPYEKRIPVIVAIISAEEKKEQNEQTKQNHKLYSQNLNSYGHEELKYLEQLSKYLDNFEQIWLQLQEKIKKEDQITKKAYEQNGNIQDMERHHQIKQKFMQTIENQYKAYEQQNLPIDSRQKKKLDKIIKEKNKKHSQDEIKKGKEIKQEGEKVLGKNNLEDKQEKREIENKMKEIEFEKEKKEESDEEEKQSQEQQQQKKEHYEIAEQVRINSFLEETQLSNLIETPNQIPQSQQKQFDSSQNTDNLSTSNENQGHSINNQIKTDSSIIGHSSGENVEKNNVDQIRNLDKHPLILDMMAKIHSLTETNKAQNEIILQNVEQIKNLEFQRYQQAEKIKDLEFKSKDEALKVISLKGTIKASEKKCAKKQKKIDSIEKKCTKLIINLVKQKSKVQALTKEVIELKLKNIQNEKMILSSSLAYIIYGKVSQEYYHQSWQVFREEKLSSTISEIDKKNTMLIFQIQAQELIGLTPEQWNILREIKDARNLIVHHSEETILTANNIKLLLRYESQVNIDLFKKCLEFLNTIKAPKVK